MTSQTGKNRWRRAVIGGVASGAMAASLLTGFGVSTAFAQPAEPTEENSCTGDDCAKADAASHADCPEGDCPAAEPTMSPDEVLTVIAQEYDTGAGGGHISNLIHDVLTLRSLGFRPSKGNTEALQEALDKRPNQTPLVEALKSTLAYQRKLQAQAANAVASSPAVLGTTPLPPGVPPDPRNPDNTGIGLIPGGGVTQPIG